MKEKKTLERDKRRLFNMLKKNLKKNRQFGAEFGP